MNRNMFSMLSKVLLGLLFLGMAPASMAQDTGEVLDQMLAADHRSEANRARDKYRHPKETLLFFGLRPDMTVVEVWPSAGWWTEILAPMLREKGNYYAAWFATAAKGAPQFLIDREKGFDAMIAGRPDLYGRVKKTALLAPDFVEFAPKGSVDMVLTFRNVHNWAKAGNADAMFKAFFDVLKPGGVLGVKDHRAKPGTDFKRQIDSGYMTEAWVIEAAEKAGFKFVDKSEINANPKDTTDYPGGVWTLPPNLRNVAEADKPKYLAIGESDRMTLKFVKP
ncbi:MAG: class I SAM-dependent methyltransferase [Burkholderiales bacterium]